MASKRKLDICKEIQALSDLCERVKEESIFQQEPLYKKFKTKHDGRRIEIMDLVEILGRVNILSKECTFCAGIVLEF